ncbi:MAG TPA: CHAT domain-containing tetratricopeptide repeat protein [Steroidobacteraceae bacterium]|nr:CHAT domain-containing tetratricopeptide repeat protein [Steroidobacteraceae bacterium]
MSSVWLLLVAQAAVASAPQTHRCPAPLAAASATRVVTVRGQLAVRVSLPALQAPVMVRVTERGIDVTAEILDSREHVLARTASPVIRTGTQLALVDSAVPSHLVIRSREHAGHSGSVEIAYLGRTGTDCEALERRIAAADMRYAAAQAAASSAARPGDRPAAVLFADAAHEYESLLADELIDPATRASIELSLASLYYYDLSQWSQSAAWSERAARSATRSPNPYAAARAKAILAADWLEMGSTSSSGGSGTAVPVDAGARFEAARALLRELEHFHLQRGETFDAALQTNNIGLAYYNEARFAAAIPYYSAALKVFEQLGETPRVALSLQNLALCDWGQGRLTAALPRFDRAVALMDAKAHPDLYLLTLNSSALAHYAAGKYDDSLRLHTRALQHSIQVQNAYFRGRSLMGLGITYYAIGDRRLARQFLRSALDILVEDLDGRGRTTTLRALAVIEHDEKRYAEAVRYNREALDSGVAASARARIKVRLASDYAALGERERARAELEPVIADPPGGDPLVRAEARVELARLRRAAGDHAAARRELEAALPAFTARQSLAGEFETRFEMARLESAQGHDDAALAAVRRALELSDEIATQTGNPEYRASVVQALRPAQEFLVDLEYRRYRRAVTLGLASQAEQIARAALSFADGTRAQSFGQILAQRFAGDDPQLAQLLALRERRLRDLADRRFYLSTREDRKAPDDALARDLRTEIASLRAELGALNARIARHAATPSPQAAAAASLEFANVPAQRAFVEYWVGREQAYAWLASKRGVRWIHLGKAAPIDATARDLHAALRRFAVMHSDSESQRLQRRQLLVRLHGLVIQPLGALPGVDELIIAADGPLHVVPFAALRGAAAGDRYLVLERSVAFVPALRYAGLRDAKHVRASAGEGLLMIDDPVYRADDARLGSRAAPAGKRATDDDTLREVDLRSLQRLASSAREAAAIARQFPRERVEWLEGLDATRDAFLQRDLARYRYIHIASHGEMDAEIPQLSALILGKFGRAGPVAEQKVWVEDLLTRTFDANVVVLSACDTSLGPEFAGEGPLSLRYAVLARGAHSVISSLWPVADEITADLMTEVYGELIVGATQADKALGMAMRKLLVQRPQLDPALWAPYVAHLAYQPQR